MSRYVNTPALNTREIEAELGGWPHERVSGIGAT